MILTKTIFIKIMMIQITMIMIMKMAGIKDAESGTLVTHCGKIVWWQFFTRQPISANKLLTSSSSQQTHLIHQKVRLYCSTFSGKWKSQWNFIANLFWVGSPLIMVIQIIMSIITKMARIKDADNGAVNLFWVGLPLQEAALPFSSARSPAKQINLGVSNHGEGPEISRSRVTGAV